MGEYVDGDQDEDEDDLAEAVHRLESNENLGLHEAVHAVIWRVLGEDIAEVADQGDHMVTRISLNRPSHPGDVIGIVAPEVYLTVRGIAFTENSMAIDRQKATQLLAVFPDPEKIRQRVWQALEAAFTCPHIEAAIRALTSVVDTIGVLGPLPGVRVHGVIDPLITPSPFAACLRSLKETIRINFDQRCSASTGVRHGRRR